MSRGALKLVKGLDAFGIDPAGMTALDIGASTGGFTDVLLAPRRGAGLRDRRRLRPARVVDPPGSARRRARARERAQHRPRAGARAVRPRGDRRLVHLADAGVAARRRAAARRRRASRSSRWSSRSSRSAASRSARAASSATRRRGAARSTRSGRGRRRTGSSAGDDVESPITGPAGNVEYLLLLRTA